MAVALCVEQASGPRRQVVTPGVGLVDRRVLAGRLDGTQLVPETVGKRPGLVSLGASEVSDELGYGPAMGCVTWDPGILVLRML